MAKVRNSLNLSQAEAARLIGIPQSSYSGYETGTRRINLSLLNRIASFYNVSIDSLICNEEDRFLFENEIERELILKFRSLSQDEKKIILRSVGISEKK